MSNNSWSQARIKEEGCCVLDLMNIWNLCSIFWILTVYVINFYRNTRLIYLADQIWCFLSALAEITRLAWNGFGQTGIMLKCGSSLRSESSLNIYLGSMEISRISRSHNHSFAGRKKWEARDHFAKVNGMCQYSSLENESILSQKIISNKFMTI